MRRRHHPRLGAAVAALGLLPACGPDADEDGPRLPSAPVEVIVDEAGIPHLYARSDEDLFFAYGYQLASDRMLQLEMFRRFAFGRLSEVLGAEGPGSAGANALADDRFARIFDWKRWGAADAALMKEQEPEHYRLTSAWVAGINARVDEIRAGEVPLPFGFGADDLDFRPERWQPDDVYVVQKMAGFGLDQSILYEVFVSFTKQFAPQTLDAIELFRPARQTFILPPDERPEAVDTVPRSGVDGQAAATCPGPPSVPADVGRAFRDLAHLADLKPLGSNNWAVDGRHTDNGMPILAGDPHLGYAFSGTVYGVHLNSRDAGGSFDAEGFAFVGAPGIFAGHNDRVAWTPTSAVSDVMDLWAIDVDDGKANVGGNLVDVVEREETIGIRDAEPDVITVTDVPGYGVIMPSTLVGSPLPIAGGGKEVLVGWTGFKARPARYFRELMRVGSLDELEAAVLRMPEMSYNFVGADATGIAYRVGVEVPRRNPLGPGREPFWTMDGSDPESFWPGGSLDPEELPHSRVPNRGWIASANNDPFGFTADGRVDDDPYYYGALYPPGWRASRIESEIERLVSAGKVTVADMQKLQLDVHSNDADDMIPAIVEAFGAVGSDPDLGEFEGRQDIATLVQLITVDWDRRMARDSAGALAFHAFAHLVTQKIISDDLSPVLFEIVLNAAPMYMLKIAALALAGEYPNGDAVMQGGRHRIVLEALAATADWLTERFGGVEPDRYRYRDMRVSNVDHAYGRGVELFELPTDGGEETVNVAQSKFLDDGKVAASWVSQWGPIERQVFSFEADGTPRAAFNFVLGNRADRSSPYFDSAMDGWVEGTYRSMPYRRSEVEAAASERFTLPAGADRR